MNTGATHRSSQAAQGGLFAHRTTLSLLITACVLFLFLLSAGPAQAVNGNGETWFMRAYNVDDSAYIYANGVKVAPDIKYLQDSGWVDITAYVRKTGRATTIRYLLWNAGGPYKATFELARRFSGSGESLQLVRRWSVNYTLSDRTYRFAFDTGNVPLGSVIGDQFGAPTDVYPSARNGGYEGYGYYNWYYANKYHSGADVNSVYAATLGRNVRATAYGKAVQVTGNLSGWGYTVLLQHNIPSVGVIYSQYSHLQYKSPLVVGQYVSKGAVIGRVGGTNGTTTPYVPHLHFEIKRYLAGGSVFGNGYYYTHPSALVPRYLDPYYIIVGY